MKQWFKKLWNKIKSSTRPSPAPVWQDEPVVFKPELPTVVDRINGYMKIGLVVGHTRNEPGAAVAAPIKSYEYFVNTELAKMAQDYAKDKYPHVDLNIYYRDGIGIVGAYTKAHADGCDCVIELHFNAFNKKAYGTETLCTRLPDDKKYAKYINDAISKVFKRTGLGFRGVKIMSLADRGGKSVAALPGTANCLVEPFFSDNLSEVQLFLSVREEYVKSLVDASVAWGESEGLLKSEAAV